MQQEPQQARPDRAALRTDEESPHPPVTFSGRRTALTTAVALFLIAGALVLRPARPPAEPPRPAAAPEQRAMASVAMGSPAAAADLGTLIADREAWLRTHPRDDAAWTVLASAYVENARRTGDTGEYPKAEQALRRSLEVRPAAKGNLEAVVAMGMLANARHDYVAAKKWGEQARAKGAGRWTAYPVLVDAYSGTGEYKLAEQAMEKLVELRPGLPAYLRAAQVYWDRGYREDAAAAMARATGAAKSPAEKAFCLARAGDLQWERGEVDEALKSYEAALHTDPAQGRALAGRARALAALGRSDEAVAGYRAALEKVPDPRYALELGELLESLDRAEEAKEPYALLRALVARESEHGVDESVTLGLFEADHGDPAVAVRVLRAQWAKVKNVQVADALGWALHRSGDEASALEYAKKATDLGLRSAEFSYHRAEIERAVGDEASARRYLQEALRTNPSFSPVRAPRARSALDVIGQPVGGGPEHMQPPTPWEPPVMPTPSAAPGDRASGSGAGDASDSSDGSGSSGSGSGSRRAGTSGTRGTGSESSSDGAAASSRRGGASSSPTSGRTSTGTRTGSAD
ncbi:lipopolysaccharide assembly protein LapB [Streptomyces sp. NRRL S-87]|uniref:tetratricopeptide repeat protein n=1 Tax=Streptomyces sp. NRRL S-87 TaxID=1463920 RepID=UPI00099DABDE|nr:tetratricopeptide repeat protein [Streptomyces sp. NRRL S-87]